MRDDSELDKKYFIDNHIYNCPFCSRRHVAYSISGHARFDWTDDKPCFVYFVKCNSCGMTSMHLSFQEIPVTYLQQGKYKFNDDVGDLDDLFFYSVPASLFVLNNKIPRVLRELFAEAEGCLKSNFLTGASACARKIVYELAKREGAQGDTYEDRINSLKAKKSEVDPTYFDTLSTIQQLTSNKVHENAYDHWEAKHLRLILATLSEILYEIYVLPELRRDKRSAILDLKAEILGGKKKTESNSSSGEDSKGG